MPFGVETSSVATAATDCAARGYIERLARFIYLGPWRRPASQTTTSYRSRRRWKLYMPRAFFQIWLVCCVLLALGILGSWVVADPGGDPALVFLVYVIFCAVGYILLRVIAWVFSPL